MHMNTTKNEYTELVDRGDVRLKGASGTITMRLEIHEMDVTSVFDVHSEDIDREYMKQVAYSVAKAAADAEYNANVPVGGDVYVDADVPRTSSTGLTIHAFDVAIVGAEFRAE